jgi:hypothetical protein
MKSIRESLEMLEDPRSASGRRYGLSSVFGLMVAAMMAGQKSLKRIPIWGRNLPKRLKERLGFRKETPCTAMLSNLLRRMDIERLERIFGTHISENGTSDDHVAMDGKTLKNSGQDGVPAVHLLSLFSTKNRGVINQISMEAGENEITAALRLLECTNIEGKIVTGDAIFAQKKSAKG